MLGIEGRMKPAETPGVDGHVDKILWQWMRDYVHFLKLIELYTQSDYYCMQIKNYPGYMGNPRWNADRDEWI